jgi:hypothetical protein
MIKKVVWMVILGVCLQGPARAAEQASLQDRMVGGAFKTMAKAYIAAADLKELKEKNIKRIEIMREDWFDRQYADVYKVIKALPPDVKDKYRIRPGMSKAEVIVLIRSLDKKEINAIIDAVPDPVITGEFNEQWRTDGTQAKGDLMGRITKLWDKIMAAVNAPAPGVKK